MRRSDFKEIEPHHWVYNYKAYRFAIRKADGALDISIRAHLVSDPTLEDWDGALRTFNDFLKKEIIARDKETG